MHIWLRRIRGAIGMGLLWAAGGAAVGGLIELILNLLPGPDDWMGVDMWPPTLAIPGFFAGVAFSAVLGIAARGRKVEDLSVARFGAWGAVGGLLLSGLLVALGFGEPLLPDLWLRAVVFIGPATLLSAVAASSSLALARMAEGRALPDSGEAPERLAGGD